MVPSAFNGPNISITTKMSSLLYNLSSKSFSKKILEIFKPLLTTSKANLEMIPSTN